MEDNQQPNLPLDERFRRAEQYALDLPEVPKEQPKPADYVKPCGRQGYCYCPRCNPR